MEGDILQQAAQRRIRRTQKMTDKSPDDLGGDLDTLQENNQLGNDISDGLPRNRRSRTSEKATNDFSLLAVDDSFTCPLFIQCSCAGFDVKVMLNTSQGRSCINRKLAERVFPDGPVTQDNNTVRLKFNTNSVITSLDISDGKPEIVLGCDFLTKHKCIINYEDRSIQIGGSKGTKVDFLSERDIPLHFRCKNLSASV